MVSMLGLVFFWGILFSMAVHASDGPPDNVICRRTLSENADFYFPEPLSYDDHNLGLVPAEVAIEVPGIVAGYYRGLFPWGVKKKNRNGLWFSPPNRGVLDFSDLHVPDSLRKLYRSHEKRGFRITFDQAFEEVIRACAETAHANYIKDPETGEEVKKGMTIETWIEPEHIAGYIALHKAGFAHSVEVWQKDDQGGERLVAGSYGVYVGGVFSGESMFYKVPNASKYAVLAMIEKLKSMGITWIDTQDITPGTKRFGARFISRDEFKRRLEEAHAKPWPKW